MSGSVFYNYPIWVWGVFLIAMMIVFVMTTLFCVQKWILSRPCLQTKTIPSSSIISAISSTYAMLIALLVFSVLNTFLDVNRNVQAEASSTGDLFRDSRGLPQDLRNEIQTHLIRYLDLVIEVEWPKQRQGYLGDTKIPGWDELDKINDILSTYNAPTLSTSVIQAELFHRLNAIYDFRRARVFASQKAVPSVVWEIIVTGAVVFLLFTSLLAAENFNIKVLQTVLVFTSITLVIMLIIALDRPFQGQLRIDSGEFKIVRQNIQHLVEVDGGPRSG